MDTSAEDLEESDEPAADQEDVPTEDAADGENDGDQIQSDEPEKGADEQFCSSCGAVIKKEAAICPECGVSVEGSSDTDPGMAALLSGLGFFIPIAAGAGQIYNDEAGKGILFCGIQTVHIFAVAFLFWLIIPLLTYPLVQVYMVYDAYQNAQ